MGPRRHAVVARQRGGRGHRLTPIALVAAGICGIVALPAAGGLRPNPANQRQLLNKPIEDYRYDRAKRCREHPPKGARAMVNWLERNVRGESWGIMRCERLGRDSFSLHSEGRAIDWRLDAGRPKERRAAKHLLGTLLERDRRGNAHALARRMGVQGLIFDCRSWWSGMRRMGKYSYCFKANGEIKHNLDRTAAHRDHVHIELNWPGARQRTSFWRAQR